MSLYIIVGITLITISLIIFLLYLVLGKAAGEKLKKELKEEY